MHILVCIKAIPDPDIAATLFRVDEDAKKVIPVPSLRFVMSPFDEQAIEGALRVREALGTAKVKSRILKLQKSPNVFSKYF